MIEPENNRSDKQDGQEHFERFVQPRLARARKVYESVLTRLWSGNGAGAGIVLAVAWKADDLSPALLISFLFFAFGLIAMALGSIVSLIQETYVIRSLEDTDHWSKMKAGVASRPSERIGLTPRDWRTRMAFVSAAFFIFGVSSGCFGYYSKALVSKKIHLSACELQEEHSFGATDEHSFGLTGKSDTLTRLSFLVNVATCMHAHGYDIDFQLPNCTQNPPEPQLQDSCYVAYTY